jgi:hypothetical protein
MWMAVFWWILKLVGPYIVEMLIDWIVGELSGAVQGPTPQIVQAEQKNYKRLKKMLLDEAKREGRLAVMREAVAKAKRTSYPSL